MRFTVADLSDRLVFISDLTKIFERVKQGDPTAAAELVPLVYNELRRLAVQKMASEAPGQTLQPTALVHEAWLRLGANAQPLWQNRAHFFSAAGEAMRRILVDSARRKQCHKHGGKLERLDVESLDLPLDEALDRLSTVDSRAVEVVKLCFFVGLTQEEAARELDVSLSTAERLWSFARAWLFREMRKMRKSE
jgi:RNA polymerase sigma factor (TIGR02999 family)